MTTTPNYPPYGRMILEWDSQMGAPRREPRPGDWKSATEWDVWLESISELLSHVLWPRYRPGRGWVGPADKFMHAITKADFALFQVLRPKMKEDEELPGGGIMAQSRLFTLEDEADAKDPVTGQMLADRSIDASLRFYLAGQLDPQTTDSIVSGYIAGLNRKSGNVDLEIKRDMQRPRAYQMAFLLDEADFSHNHAKSAVTPSMISGHCIEAMMGGVAAWYRLQKTSVPVKQPEALDALARHTIDVGDRRVFGGVHYPSDNISSWLTGLLMCPHVCPDDAGAKWLWAAIKAHSRVHRELVKVGGNGSPYELSLALLDHVAGLSQPTVDDAMAFVAGWKPTSIAAE